MRQNLTWDSEDFQYSDAVHACRAFPPNSRSEPLKEGMPSERAGEERAAQTELHYWCKAR